MACQRLLHTLLTLLLTLGLCLEAGAGKKSKGTDWDDDAEKELPPLELHGYFRFRGDLFHNYDLGYTDKVAWQDGKLTSFFTPYSERSPNKLIPGLESSKATANNVGADTQGSGTLRFRLEPTVNVTEDIRLRAQIDIFDNLVMGSTPDGFPNPSGFSSISAFTSGQVPPSDGQNALRDSIRVKRAWAEVMTPFGQLSFGRMAAHWGMGLVVNDGNCQECDYGTTYDRVMFVTKVLGHYVAPFMDFASEGITSDVAEMINVYRRGSAGLGSIPAVDRFLGRPFDLDQRDDVNQFGLAIVKRDSPKELREKLANGETVVNYGLYTVFRNQGWASDNRAYATFGNAWQGRLDTPDLYRQPLFERRGARVWMFDPWFKLLTGKTSLEAEAAFVVGTVDESVNGQPLDVFQWGAALRFSQKFLDDALVFTFEAGVASGADGSGTGIRDGVTVAPSTPGTPARATNFKFNPDFQVDRILWREIVGAVTDAWYAKPSLQYNVTENFGLKVSAIYSHAMNHKQWPGGTPTSTCSPVTGVTTGCASGNLGLEFNVDLFYKLDDVLYASFGYGGLVPFAGLREVSTQTDPTYAQTIYTRLVVRY